MIKVTFYIWKYKPFCSPQSQIMKPLNYFALVFSICFISANLYAQNDSTEFEIQGTIIDSISEAPLANASIILIKSADAVSIKGVITNNQGFFKLENIELGSYELHIEFLGYKKKVLRDLMILNGIKSLNLGRVKLSEMPTVLDEVVIQAKKPIIENKLDRFVYNIQESTMATGGADELLRKIPMTTVDINGNASIRGNRNVGILINGKPAGGISGGNGEILQSIPASQIKSVEIITSPSSKYDAEGSGGMINIITRKATIDGMNGTFSTELGTRLWNGSISLYGKHKKVVFGINIGTNNKFPRTIQKDYFSLDDEGNKSNSLERGKNERLTNNASATIQYNSDQYNSISSSFRIINLGFKDNLLGFSENNSVDSNLINFETRRKGERGINGFDWNADYLHKFNEKGENINLASQWKRDSRNENYQSFFSSFFIDQEGQSKAESNEYTVLLDYAKPLKKSGKLEVGVKSIFRKITSINNFFDLDDSGNRNFNDILSNIYDYQQDVFAIYISWLHTFKNGWGFQIGNRFEATRIKGQTTNIQTGILSFSNNFNNNIPNVILSKKFSNLSSLKISYNKRIQRPSLEFVNPFRDLADPLNQSQGTPDLSPEITQAMELTFNPFIKKVTTSFSVFYRKTDQMIESFIETVPYINTNSVSGDPLIVNLSTFQNVGSHESFGVSVFGVTTSMKKFTLQGNFDIFSYKAQVEPQFESFLNPGTFIQYSGFTSLDYDITDKIIFSTFYSFQSKYRNFQGNTSNLNIWNIALRKEIFKTKGTVGFSITNPLNDTWDFVDDIHTASITTRNTLSVPLRTFNLKFTYDFGKPIKERPEDRRINNTDLKDKKNN